MQQELLPQVRAVTPFSDDAGRTVVAGQSFGYGLSALWRRPELADAFWLCTKPVRIVSVGPIASPAGGEVITRLKNRRIMRARTAVVLEAGVREPIVFQANRALAPN